MKRYRIFGVIAAVCISLSILYSLVGNAQIPSSKVLLSTKPSLEHILPFEAEAQKQQSPVTLTLQAVDAGGKSLENAKISLQILTPNHNPWLTTDYPLVEGTKLLEMNAIAPDGKLEVQQILPIRGNYQLLVKVSPLRENTFTPYQQTLNLNVRENPIKYKYFVVIAAILLSVGLLGGWVIGGQEELQQGEIAPQSVRLLLSALTVVAIVTLLVINISAEVAEAHGSGHNSTSTEVIAPSSQKSQGLEISLEGDKNATVGKLANLGLQVKDTATGQPIKDVALQVKAIAIEHNLTVFAYKGIADEQGKLTWQEQFFDGSPHKIEVEATPNPGSRQFTPVKVAQEVEVEAIAPPIYIRLIGLFYFTAFVGIGMVIGLLIQHRRTPQLRVK
jgi:hypothetical protein